MVKVGQRFNICEKVISSWRRIFIWVFCKNRKLSLTSNTCHLSG